MKSILLFLSAFCFTQAFSQIEAHTVTDPFSGSGGVKISSDGWVYVADYGETLPSAGGTQIHRYDPESGTFEEFTSGLNGASGNVFDAEGNLFQSNITSSTISKVLPDGTVEFYTSTGISGPVGLAMDEEGNLYVCNCGNNTIRKVTPALVSTSFSSGSLFSCPNGITFDHLGNLYVSNFNNGNVLRIDASGEEELFTTIPGNNNGHLTYNDVDSNLYVASHGSSNIYRVDLEGEVEVLIGTGVRGNDDGGLDEATFSRPNGIVATVSGDTLYLNSSIPTSNVGLPLNPSVLRMITGVLDMSTGLEETYESSFSEFSVIQDLGAGLLRIQLSLTAEFTGNLTLFNLEGRSIDYESLQLNQGAHELTMDLYRNITSGWYILSLENNVETISRRVFIR